MPIPDIHITIAELASLYDTLNQSLIKDTCETDVLQVYRQKEYREIYEKLKDFNVESIAIKVIADSISDKVLSRLHALIQENISTYEARQDDFKKIKFDELYQLWENHLFGDKRALLLNDKKTIKEYPYPTEREREILLKENQKDINELDNERSKSYRSDAAWIRNDYYSNIYKLSCSFASILENYFPVEEKKKAEEPKPIIQQGFYFDMQLVSLIHNECNNIQFENLKEVDLYALLNLQPTNAQLIVKTGERTRMCFLIYKLYEYLKIENRADWRMAILKVADIKEEYYKSKYMEPKSEASRGKSKIFAERIGDIFNNIA